MTTLPQMQRFIGPALLSTYAVSAALTWLHGGVFVLLAWLSSALASMYLTARLTTFSKVSPWDSFWRPVIGVTWFWISAAFIALCTPDLFSYFTWHRALLAFACMAPLAAAWYKRAMGKPKVAYAWAWLHLLALLGATTTLDSL